MARGIKRTEPAPHGTRVRYSHGGCRCEECRKANAVYAQRLKLRNARGRGRFVDAEPVRERVRALMAPYQGSTDGLGYERLADLAGVSRGVVRRLIYGMNGYPPTKRIRRDLAEKILSVDARSRAPGATVAAGPTLALAECMLAFGAPSMRLGALLGDRGGGASRILRREGRPVGRVTVRKARDVEGLHWALWKASGPFREHCVCRGTPVNAFEDLVG